ncbi:MAG: hypothetical protein GVX96_00265 [Bacteroidetes bacterium]|nr:hypothetical protein [Bacteroidota bacterium]
MLQLFKNNHFANALVLFPLAIAVQLSMFFVSSDAPAESNGWLYAKLLGERSIPLLWQAIISGIFVFFQAVFINRLSIIHRLNNEINILPGFIWLFWSSWHPDMLGLSGIHPALLCILIGMNDLMHCFKKRNRAIYVFNTGFFFSLASLFYFPLLSAIVFGLFMFFVFLSIRFPEPQQYIAGIFVPYFLSFCTAYYWGYMDSFTQLQWLQYDFGSIFSDGHISSLEWTIVGLSLFILMVALVNMPFYHAKKEIFSQRKITMLFVYILFALLGSLFLNQFALSYLLLPLWPAAIFISDTLYSMKNAVLAELVVWLFIGISFFMQYEFLF